MNKMRIKDQKTTRPLSFLRIAAGNFSLLQLDSGLKIAGMTV